MDYELDGQEPDIIGDIVDQTHGDGGREQVPETSSDPIKAFGLLAQPFADNVNPEFFFRTEAHEEAFLAMQQCIDEHVSLGLCTATSGTGKTLLTQVLMQKLDPRRFQPVLVLAYPGMSRTALLQELASELKLAGLPVRPNTHAFISTIQAHIIRLYLQGLRLILIIDEVHFLSADSLHLLRTLSNIEVPEQKLVTVLLFGEQSFLEKMKHPNYASIFSRMFWRTEIRPLRQGEIAQYVKFRLLMAGGAGRLFHDNAYEPLLELSRGIPREINRLCYNALKIVAREGRPQVTREVFDALRQSRKI